MQLNQRDFEPNYRLWACVYVRGSQGLKVTSCVAEAIKLDSVDLLGSPIRLSRIEMTVAFPT
jgi:hypothetical protein